jgi:hypothetical protein
MAQRRRIGTIRIKQTRRITVRTTVQRRVVTQPVATRQRLPASTPPRQLTRRTSRLSYSPSERQFLDGVREVVEADVDRPRDVFLCHAWADRSESALELFEALAELGTDVWFSERDVVLGRSLARQLDAGLRISRVGVVLVTPSMLAALRTGGFADQELGALLATQRVIPVMHNVSYDDLRAESPLLAARAGLSTDGSSLGEVAAKIAESVLDVELM